MKKNNNKILISLLLSLLMVIESSISVAAISGADCGCEDFNEPKCGVELASSGNAEPGTDEKVEKVAAETEPGTDENLEQVEALLEIKDSDGEEMELSELEESEYDGFLYTLKDTATKDEIREMENEIDDLSGNAEVEEVVSNELYIADSPETISEVASADIIDTIEPDYINTLSVYSSEPNDKYYKSCIYNKKYDVSYKNILSAMNVQQVWKRGYFGSGEVTVAVIDSGVNEGHEELKGKVEGNLAVKGDSITNFGNTEEDRAEEGSHAGHASFAAGIICAENNNGVGISGAMPCVNILSIRIFYKDKKGTLCAKNSDIAAAIKLAAKKGVDVINMSFGQPNVSSVVKSACEAAAAKGIILVAASGNDSSTAEKVTSQYPAAYDCVIGVGSVAATTLKRSEFSNVDVDVVAPGETSPGLAYVGLDNDGTSSGYTVSRGTSCASPQVAALAAMAKSIDEEITASEFKALLCETAEDLGQAGRDAEYGYGLVDYEALLNELVGKNGRADSVTTGINGGNSEVGLEYDSVVYSGTERKPKVALAVNGVTLVQGQDYSVRYTGNVGIGTAKVTVNGINNYSGRLTGTFAIVPKCASIATPASGKNSVTVKWKALTSKMKVTRSSGLEKEQITGYQVQLAANSDFTSGLKKSTVGGYSKASKTVTGLKRKRKYYVRVRTYKTVDSTRYYSSWSETKAMRTK